MRLLRTEKLYLFFSKIREITFWQRLFSWRAVRNLSYEAYEEYKGLDKNIAATQSEHDAVEKRLATITTQHEGLQSKLLQYEKAEIKKDSETVSLYKKIEELNNSVAVMNRTVSKHETTEEERTKNYENKITQLNQLKESLNNEIKRLSDERVGEQKFTLEKMKKQWTDHETSVQQSIKTICQNHFIKYVDNVPFKGNPDNTIEICEEYIILMLNARPMMTLPTSPNI